MSWWLQFNIINMFFNSSFLVASTFVSHIRGIAILTTNFINHIIAWQNSIFSFCFDYIIVLVNAFVPKCKIKFVSHWTSHFWDTIYLRKSEIFIIIRIYITFSFNCCIRFCTKLIPRQHMLIVRIFYGYRKGILRSFP